MRLPWPAVALGVLAIAAGATGLVRGLGPAPAAASSSPASAITVRDAYVRPPVPPNTTAAAYFTIKNSAKRADTLETVTSGAGRSTVLHATVNGEMRVTASLSVPPGGSVVLSPGKGHVMIENLIGSLRAGEQVTLTLTFAHAGTITVSAVVIGATAPQPTFGPSGASR